MQLSTLTESVEVSKAQHQIVIPRLYNRVILLKNSNHSRDCHFGKNKTKQPQR